MDATNELLALKTGGHRPISQLEFESKFRGDFMEIRYTSSINSKLDMSL